MISHRKPIKAANQVACKVCEMAIQYLDRVLSSNATEAEVKAALDSLCENLPSSLKTEVR